MNFTPKEKQCLIAIHLAGMSIFDDAGRPDCKTVRSLTLKGMFSKTGLSELGKQTAKELAELDHAKRIA